MSRDVRTGRYGFYPTPETAACAKNVPKLLQCAAATRIFEPHNVNSGNFFRAKGLP